MKEASYGIAVRWPELAMSPPLENLEACIHYLSDRFCDAHAVLEEYPSPTLEDYLRLHERHLEVIRMEVELTQAAHASGQDIAALQSLLEDLESALSDALFVLPVKQPKMLEEYILQVGTSSKRNF